MLRKLIVGRKDECHSPIQIRGNLQLRSVRLPHGARLVPKRTSFDPVALSAVHVNAPRPIVAITSNPHTLAHQVRSYTGKTSATANMANKKTGPTSDELLAQFDTLSTQPTSTRPTKSSSAKPRTNIPSKSSQTENDLLKDLGDLAAARPPSRSGTPSLRASQVTGPSRSPARSSTATPPPGRNSEEKAVAREQQRKSGDSNRSTQPAYTPATTTADESPEPSERSAPVQQSGGGWFSGFLSTATAAVSQAQKAVQDIQQSEDAQKYLEQVRGNVGVIRGFGVFISVSFIANDS
jgi:hypothetical protein